MPEKILYYLGAGASVNALPLAKTVYMPGTNKVQILGLAYELKIFDFKELIAFSQANTDSHTALLTSIAENFKKLADKADEFGDVDTYAKYLKIDQSGGNELKNLKQTLSWFFFATGIE